MNAQKDFDREARCLKRRWKREQVLQLEKLNCEDPNEFWAAVKRLGRRSRKPIPEAVYTEEGDISTDRARRHQKNSHALLGM